MLKLLVELQTELKELKADVRQLRVASVPPVQAVADEEEYQLPDGVVMPCRYSRGTETAGCQTEGRQQPQETHAYTADGYWW